MKHKTQWELQLFNYQVESGGNFCLSAKTAVHANSFEDKNSSMNPEYGLINFKSICSISILISWELERGMTR